MDSYLRNKQWLDLILENDSYNINLVMLLSAVNRQAMQELVKHHLSLNTMQSSNVIFQKSSHVNFDI